MPDMPPGEKPFYFLDEDRCSAIIGESIEGARKWQC
jgi:hypothetical protein